MSEAAVCSALLPDLLVGWALLTAQIPAQVVFSALYVLDTWQSTFASDHSISL